MRTIPDPIQTPFLFKSGLGNLSEALRATHLGLEWRRQRLSLLFPIVAG